MKKNNVFLLTCEEAYSILQSEYISCQYCSCDEQIIKLQGESLDQSYHQGQKYPVTPGSKWQS